MRYLLTEEEIAARDSVRRGVAGPRDDFSDLACQLGRTPLVGVDDEYPARSGPDDGVVARRADGGEGGADDRRSRAARAIDGVVGGLILDDDHLTRPVDAGDAGLN